MNVYKGMCIDLRSDPGVSGARTHTGSVSFTHARTACHQDDDYRAYALRHMARLAKPAPPDECDQVPTS